MRKEINLTKHQLKKFTATKPLGKGNFGKVYRYDEQHVIKIWNKKKYGKTKYENIKDLCEITTMYKSIILPKTKVFTTNHNDILTFKGYLIRYFVGCDLAEIKNILKWQNFLKALYKTELQLQDFSKSYFLIDDVTDTNLLYNQNNDTLAFIDCDYWRKADNLLSKQIFEENINYITTSLKYMMVQIESNLDKFIQADNKLKAKFEAKCFSLEQYHEFLEMLKSKLEQYTNQKIITLDDFNRVLEK